MRATFSKEQFDRRISKALQKGIAVDQLEDDTLGKHNVGRRQPEQLRTSKQRSRRLNQTLKRMEEEKRNFVNVTDPESGFEAKGKTLLPSYNAKAVVDEGGVIVEASVRANPADCDGLPEAIENIQDNF